MRRATKWIMGGAIGLGLLVVIAIVVLGGLLFSSARRGIAQYQKGMADLDAGRKTAAIASFELALQEYIGPRIRSSILLARGRGRQDLGDSAGALRDYNEAIRLSPQSAELYAWRGVLSDETGDASAAMEDYSRGLTLDPNLGGILNRRGNLYLQQGQWDEAIANFSEAIRVDPNDAASYASRAIAYGRKNELDAALASFASALQLQPQAAWIQIERESFLSNKARSCRRWRITVRPSVSILRGPTRCALDPGFMRLPGAVRKKSPISPTCSGLIGGTSWRRSSLPSPMRRKVTANTLSLRLPSGSVLPSPKRPTIAGRTSSSSEASTVPVLEELREAVRSGWSGLGGHWRLAWLLATCPDPAFRDGRTAVAEAMQACERSEWKHTRSIDVLTAAYAETGDFAQALNYERQALASDRVDPRARGRMEDRLALYRRGLPYHTSSNAEAEEE